MIPKRSPARNGLLPLLVAALWLSGCGGESPPEWPAGGVLRLIGEEPTEHFAPERLYELEESFSWTLAGAESEGAAGTGKAATAPPWTVRGAEVLRGEPGEVGFATTGRRTVVTFEVDLEAETLDALEIDLAGHPFEGIELRWATKPGRFATGARMTGEILPHDRSRADFRLLGEPAWKGRIRRLALVVKLGRDRRFQIERVVGRRRTAGAGTEPFRESLARAWKVDLGKEWRSARLAGSEGALSWKVVVPEGACLEFGYGATGDGVGAVSFRVGAVPAGSGPDPLFEEVIDWSEAEPGWRNGTVDLADRAGEEIELRFEVDLPGNRETAIDFPVWGDPKLRPCSGGSGRPDKRWNLLLVSLDTLRADRLSAYGYSRETSPHLDAWAADSAVLFRHTVAPASWTLPSHASMFTGLDAHRHGVTHSSEVPLAATTLAEILRGAGYVTAAVTGGGFVHPALNFFQGFDSYRYWQGKRRRSEMVEEVDAAVRWIESAPPGPWFLFFHTYEVHTPYDVRQPFFDRFSRFRGLTVREGRSRSPRREDGFEAQTAIEMYRAQGPGAEELTAGEIAELVSDIYDSGVAYADQELARLFAALERSGLTERTLVIVTSDHGEMLGEHGGRAHHAFLFEENLLVPLMIAAPGNPAAGKAVERQVGVVDVTPTALDLLGIEVPPGLDGVSLAELVRGGEMDGPAEVWSHSGQSNRGISLRLDNRRKYLYNHAAWEPISGKESLLELGGLEESGGEEVGALRERVREMLRTSASGLRIRLRNSDDHELTGTLRSGILSAQSVKSWDVEPGEVWWDGPGRVGFRLAPGRAFHLLIEGRQIAPIEIALGPTSAQPSQHSVTGYLLDSAYSVTGPSVTGYILTAEGWAPSTDAEAGTGIWAWWQGDFPPTGSPPAETDRDLQEDLRALGYVE